MMTIRLRLLFFGFLTLISLYFGYFYFEPVEAVTIFSEAGYWTIALSWALFVYCLYRAFWGERAKIVRYFRTRAGIAGLIVTAVGVLFVYRSEPLGFKTIMDEHIVAATARSLHLDRTATVPSRSVTVLNVQQESHKFVDKRPLLQAFLVATVHDLTGYRSYNSIYLNVFLTPFSLLLIYVIGQRMGGISVGVMASLLLATLPLFSYMSAGGGMETVNVLFILTAWFLGGLYLVLPIGLIFH